MIYIVSTLLLVSLILISVGFWYIRNLLSYSHSLVIDFIEINENLKSFAEHIEKVYTMDRFHGDGTLEGLLRHAKDLSTEVSEFVTQKNDLFEDEPKENEYKEGEHNESEHNEEKEAQ
jgi:hypothetical protein